MNLRYISIIIILAVAVGIGILWRISEQKNLSLEILKIEKIEEFKDAGNESEDQTEENETEYPEDKQVDIYEDASDAEQFRNQIVNFVRASAENYFDKESARYPEELEIKGIWEPDITIYHKGEIKGQGQGKAETLLLALSKAVENVFEDERSKDLNKENIKDARFLVKLLEPPNGFSFIEYDGQGKELIKDLVVIRNLDKELIEQKIKQGKEFLYRMENKDEHGFYKKYDTLNDTFENRLHTVYSASIIYTFLYIYDLEKDEKILEDAVDWANFLLSMQNKDKEDKRYGAFHYSFYLDNQEKEKKFVVGTSALSIFTLLRMYDLTEDSKYLESAKLAGDWLATMQEPDGSMKPYTRYSDGKWVYGKKESLLYNGQVLSSLSKLYAATGDKKYYDTAEGIAKRFAEKYEEEKGYIQGEYRKKNPISNSWAVMSSMDFYKVSQDDRYKNVIFELSEKVLENQKNNPDDISHYGG